MRHSLLPQCISRARAGLAAAGLGLLLAQPLQATVLDDFNGAKTGWTDTLNSGAVNQSGGQFTIATATNSGSLTYSRKTSAAFTNAASHTVELRVDVNTASPGNSDPNVLAILGWVPGGGALLGSGYSLLVGSLDVKIQKGSSVVYATNYAAAGVSLQNTNITLVLRMTPAGSAVSVNARVYKRIPNGSIGQYFTRIFEYTYQDSSGLIGSGGNAALGVKNQASTSGASAAFDNLQVFDTVHSLLDDFSGGLDTSKWTVFKKNPGLGDTVTVSGGQLDVLATIADTSGGFAGIYSANQTFKIIDGGRVEFQLDILQNIGGANSYSALGYLPVANPQYIYGIVSYHIANDYVGHTVVVNGKGYNEWWGGRNDIQPPTLPPGCRYILTMTGEGTNCRIESRIEDLSITDVNDPARLVWQTEFVDTPAADAGLNEATLANPFPYLNFDGRFIITTFNSGAIPPNQPNWAEVLYDNAVYDQTLPPKSAPILANVTPGFGTNFLPASATLAFDATDAANIPLNSLGVILNGVTYTNGSPGVTITPTSASSTSRHFSLSGALTANVNYVGTAFATDANDLSSSSPFVFDTFLANNYAVEIEDYNFSTNWVDMVHTNGGVFIDNPVLVPENAIDPNAYSTQLGVPEIDFHDNRGTAFYGHFGYDTEHTWRVYDLVYTTHSSDPARAKINLAGGSTLGYYEQEVQDIHDGDWLNYTHTFPAGTYNVFLRQATFKVQNSLVTLEKVTSDPTVGNQTTSILGSFAATTTGIGLFANVPLSDGPGNLMVVRFSGAKTTLRLMNRITGNADLDTGNLEQNYLIFVPVADPGTLRPVVTSVSPSANSTFNSPAPVLSASIANRDTSVNTANVLFQVNGDTVGATVTPTAGGADVSYTLPYPLPPANSMVTNTLIFQDSAGIYQTNTWTWMLTYNWLRAANSLPLGSLNLRGFEARMVQTDNGGAQLDNTLLRAEQQLAIPPQIPFDRTATSIVQVLNWNKASSPPNNVPGLCPGSYQNIAVESFAYLELTAGLHRFHINTDDRAGLYSGAGLRDANPAVLWENPGNTANATFDFVVEATGLYPVRCVWEETGGGAALALYSTNLAGGAEVLVNDPGNPAGGVKAWYPLVCQSAAAVTGPYAADSVVQNVPTYSNIACDLTLENINQMVTGGTLTIPMSGSTRFYRLASPRGTRITSIAPSGSNVVLTYQLQ